MKLTLVLFAVLLAFVPHGSQALSLSEVLESTSHKTQGMVNDALAKAEEIVADAKAKAAQWGEELKKRVREFLQKMENRVNEVLQRINERVNEIVGDLDGPNVSECQRLAGTVRDAFIEVIEDDKQCVIGKVVTGKGYIANISAIANEVRRELKALQEEAHRCTENIDGIKATAGAIVCVNKVGLTAAWITATRLPEATGLAIKLGFLVNTLPITLPHCASKNGFNVLTENVDQLLSGVKQCVKESVEGDKKHPETTVASTVTVPTTVRVPEITESVTETTELVDEVTETVDVTDLPNEF
ncbi:uncharacterized protein LOC107038848 [Diachasma alloeum]|uniref:uncharacterized protein LOC107038848 n=1 Tax=Diachasma alloeum TaxID=454923 RepID=UPI0007384035|nr:uncharacterized protein LOC107038848 [Diachasma alloeum]